MMTEEAGRSPAGPPGNTDSDSLHRRPVLFPNAYTWFVFVSAMDVMLTWAILTADGSEVNPIAAFVIAMWGLYGAIVFKFGLTLFVIVVCEITGRRKHRLGWTLSRAAVVISGLPVAYSLVLLSVHVLGFVIRDPAL